VKNQLFLLLFCVLGLQASEAKEAKVRGVDARLQQALARVADLEAQLAERPDFQQPALSQNRQSQLDRLEEQLRREQRHEQKKRDQRRADEKKAKKKKAQAIKVKAAKASRSAPPRKKVSSHPMAPLYNWAENCCCFCCIKQKCCRKKR